MAVGDSVVDVVISDSEDGSATLMPDGTGSSDSDRERRLRQEGPLGVR